MPSPRGRGFRRVSGNAALLIASLLVAFAIGEAVVRASVPGAAPTGGGPRLYRYDPILGWSKRPDVTVSMTNAEWRTTIRTNALGLRGPDVPVPKPPGTKRVLLLGDSFIEGYSVAQDETVSSRLEAMLAETLPGPVEVLNAGTAGYSTDQELLFFRRDGAALEPDLTVLFFYHNDLWYNVRPNYWRGAKPWFELADTGLVLQGVPVPRTQWSSREFSDWLTGRSALYRLVRQAVGSWGRRGGMDADGEARLPSPPGEFMSWRREGDAEVDAAWSLTEALVVELRDRVEEAGGDFLLFWVPSKPAVYDEVWTETRDGYAMSDDAWSPSADADRIAEICDRGGLDCVLPLARFRERAPELGAAGAPYFPIDGHWTAAGHDLAASLIAEWLERAGARPLP